MQRVNQRGIWIAGAIGLAAFGAATRMAPAVSGRISGATQTNDAKAITIPAVASGSTSGAAFAAPLQTTPVRDGRMNCYFGDLHLHSGYSLDAFVLGSSTTPEDSYRYAQGERVLMNGKMQKRKAPLDFLAVTDHAEYLGVMPEVPDPKGPFVGTTWQNDLKSPDPGKRRALFSKLVMTAARNERIPDFEKPELLSSTWSKYASFADKYNRPGKFTTFVAFEWTSAPGNQNLHRCVIFKDKGPEIPFTSLDSQDPEELWTYLEKRRAEGNDVIAIPHNGNISNGLMFDPQKTYSGNPITADYARRRMANEPLFEMIQVKGQSETRPELSPNDEFANFETFDYLLSTTTHAKFNTGSYIRQAYGRGMELSQKIGVNPFKYGIEAGTDIHHGLSATEEFNYLGGHGASGAKELMAQLKPGIPNVEIGQSSGGLTGVWAQSNTRAAIFDALKRRETFGTSGNRIKVRMFAGYGIPKDWTRQPGWEKQAYSGQMPLGITRMGGDLPIFQGIAQGDDERLKSGAMKVPPIFAVQALKDPDSGNLDRIQIIKVQTKDGKTSEKIYDVVWAGNRKIDPKTGKLPSIGSTVDLKNVTYKNSIGAAELRGVWIDPDFDRNSCATYYARVLEIPTPRWSSYWAKQAGVAPPDSFVPSTVVERAWTSPIFYRN